MEPILGRVFISVQGHDPRHNHSRTLPHDRLSPPPLGLAVYVLGSEPGTS
jgi:hypothetical protein